MKVRFGLNQDFLETEKVGISRKNYLTFQWKLAHDALQKTSFHPGIPPAAKCWVLKPNKTE